MADLSPEALHNRLLARAPRILQFDPEAYFPEWQGAVRRSFKQLLGVMPTKGELELRVTFDEARSKLMAYREIRFSFLSEPGVEVPCVLAIPKQAVEVPAPVVICLQSHEVPAAASLGVGRDERERRYIAAGHDFALQAMGQGYATLTFDLRALGARADARPEEARRGAPKGCHHAALNALLAGRTLMGERAWDVTRAVDAMLEGFAQQVDVTRIAVMGFSAGGAVAYYAAALDTRLAAAVVVSAISTYAASLGRLDRCDCNYLPNIVHYLDMADMAGLIAPRPLLVVSGVEDPLNPAEATRETFEEIRSIYRTAGAEATASLHLLPGGHHPFPREMWPLFNELTGWQNAKETKRD